jgi:hypothetical protein
MNIHLGYPDLDSYGPTSRSAVLDREHWQAIRARQVIETKAIVRAKIAEEAETSRRQRQLADQAMRLDMSTRALPMPADAGLIVDVVVLAADIDAAAAALQVHPATLLEWMDQPGNRAHVDTIHRRRARASAFCARAVTADDLRDPQSRGVELKALTWEAERMDRASYADRLPAAQPEIQVSIPAGDLLRAAMQIAQQAGLLHEMAALMSALQGESRRVPAADKAVDKSE